MKEKRMEAQIRIGGAVFGKEFLLGTREGQAILRDSKGQPERPVCMCATPAPAMYISRRGGMFFLSRMPGSANQHESSCQSHIIDTYYRTMADELPAEVVLNELLTQYAVNQPEKKHWGAIRQVILHIASQIRVDGAPLLTRLLVPEPFNRERFEKLQTEYDAFFHSQSTDENRQARYWTLGLLKESIERQYNYQTTIKHMPSTKFWVHKDVAEQFPQLENDSTHIVCLFSCRKINSGVEVDEAATALVDGNFAVFRPIDGPSESELHLVRSKLGVPATWPREAVFGKLVQNFLFGSNTNK